VTEPVRVLVAHNRYRSALPSGENTIVDGEIEGLRARGVAVDLLIAESDDIADFGTGARLALPIRPTWSAATRRRFRALLADRRPDVVHLHNPFPLLSPMVVRWAKDAGLPVVQSVHNVRHACLAGTWFRDGHDCRDCVGHRWSGPGVRHGCHTSGRSGAAALAVAQGVHRGTWSLVDRYLAVSRSVTEALTAIGVDDERIEVRPNGVDDPGPTGTPGEDVLYAGRLTQEKGVDLLLAAWDHGHPPGARLRIAGDGPLRPGLEDAARADPSIVVLGLLDRSGMQRELASAGVVLVPSRGPESCPTIVLEALAAGRAVVATDVGGLPELVSGEVGATTERTPEALAAGLAEAWTDRVARGAAARARYLERYTSDRALDRLLAVYAELAA
jgi:glycosyltransferase involved in cell wall biosynthesis